MCYYIFMDKIFLGSHVSMNAPDYYLGSVKEAIEYGANTFMFYTGAPQNSIRKPTKELKIEEARKLLQEHGFDESKLVVHAPYIINPANFSRQDLYHMSIDFITREVRRANDFHATILVLHPGASVGQDRDKSIEAISKALDWVFDNTPGIPVKIALETMSGKGTELGVTFNEIKRIIDGCKYPERLGVCLDTCHISDYGYDINDFDNILKEFDSIIGLNKLLVVHLNDSKNVRGARKDRHENVGFGSIGFDNLYKIAHHPLLTNIPKILETPYYNEKPPYKKEISMLLNNNFDPNWRENF